MVANYLHFIKMPKTKAYIDRVRIINRCLHNSKRIYSLEALTNRINSELNTGISERAVEKDIKDMRAENAPIRNKPGVGYYYDPPGYNHFEIPILPAHLQKIKLAADLLRQIPGLEIHEELSNIFKDLQINIEEDREEYIQFDTRPDYAGSKYMAELLEAIQGKTVISFDYQPFKYDEARPVVLHPYLLKEFNNRWFLIGLPESRRKNGHAEFHQYALERIKSRIKVESKITHFTHPDFDSAKLYHNVYGMSITPGGQVLKIVLRFSPIRAKYVETNPLHHTQKKIKENENTFSFELIPNPELQALILSYGTDVEVMEPKSLRQEINRTQREAIKNNS